MEGLEKGRARLCYWSLQDLRAPGENHYLKRQTGQFALVAANCLNKLNCRQGDGQYFMMEEAAWSRDNQPLA